MAKDKLVAIVVIALTTGLCAFFAKTYGLPELYAVCGLLLYFLGELRGKPTAKRIERTLRKLPPAQLDQLYERVSGRPSPRNTPPIRLEGGHDDA